MENLSLGNELKDGYAKTSKWIKANLDHLQEMESFYKQRAAIEREYAEKLSKLTSESFITRSKMAPILSVGDEPTMTPGSLECASMVAWKEVLLQTENIAKEKKRFANVLEQQIAGDLSRTNAKYSKIRERWQSFNDETISIRDKNFSDMSNKKKIYDQACEAMESQRVKSMKGHSDKAKEKQLKREHEMNIAKNSYLISISVCNRLKDKYCYQDTPELLDGLQGLNEAKVSKVNSILLTASALETDSNNKLLNFNTQIESVVKQNLPRLDTAMFIKHNMSNWIEPADFQYIPCQFWHDDESMITDDIELNDLKIKFNDACVNYEKYTSICNDEKQEVEEQLVSRNELVGITFNEVVIKSSDDYNKFDELLNRSITSLQKFTNDDTRRVISEATIETIRSATGDIDMSITFSAQKEKKSVFGFLKRDKKNGGHDEEDEDQVHEISDAVNDIQIQPANHKIRAFSSLGTVVNNIAENFNKPADQILFNKLESNQSLSLSTATAIYAYDIVGDDELNMSVGENFTVIELDDGTGWTVVQNSQGQDGLVPTSYLKITQATPPPSHKKQGPKVVPRRGAKKVMKMEILYDYIAQGDDELSVSKGDQIVVLHEDDGSGWTEGEFAGNIGLLPTSYGHML